MTYEALRVLLGMERELHAPSILIFTEEKSPRLSYACDFIFHTALNVNYTIISDPAVFTDHEGFKLNYSNRDLFLTPRIVPAGLLSEKEIGRLRPVPEIKGDHLYLYPTKGDLHFDIFSAVFYMVSRLEEWQAYTPDKHQRFEANQSILFTHSFHLKPVTDEWIGELKSMLLKKYPDLKFPEKKCRILSTIDVDNLYAYRRKGWRRTLGASARDLIKMDLSNLRERLRVLSGRKKDPFDIYEEISDFCFEKKIPLIYFFLFRSGTRNDRTVNPRSKAYDQVFEIIKRNKAFIGIHPSYYSGYNEKILSEELHHIRERLTQPVQFSRQHFLRFDIRVTPQILMKFGIRADFTMGYASAPGFRAGTSRPFHFYDFNTESVQKLLFVPFCVMDGAFTVYGKEKPAQALETITAIFESVKSTGGNFVTVFHERTFSDHLYEGFGTLYKNLHVMLSQRTGQ